MEGNTCVKRDCVGRRGWGGVAAFRDRQTFNQSINQSFIRIFNNTLIDYNLKIIYQDLK